MSDLLLAALIAAPFALLAAVLYVDGVLRRRRRAERRDR